MQLQWKSLGLLSKLLGRKLAYISITKYRINYFIYIHPFSFAYPCQGCGVAGAYPSYQRARGGVHPGQAHSLTRGWCRMKKSVPDRK